MKKIFLILATAALSLGSFAGNPNEGKDNNPPDKYCAEFKNGVLCVTHNGEVLTHDVMLSNGKTIHTDGVITRNGIPARVMKPGECVNAEGVMEGGNVENKNANEPVKTKVKDKVHKAKNSMKRAGHKMKTGVKNTTHKVENSIDKGHRPTHEK